MDRRSVVSSGVTFGAVSLAGCTTPPAAPPASRPKPPLIGSASVQPIDAPFVPVQSSMDRVTRSLVGLRPFRKPGPRLEAVKVGSKDVIHNYGHGGGGVSLSWGVGELATDLVKPLGRSEVAVLGAGSVGLSTARCLQMAGAEVTLYAKDFPPNTVSNVAGAMWHPVTLFERGEVSAETMAMLHLASRIAFLRFVRFANDRRYGVYWIRQYGLSNGPMDTSEPYMGKDSLYPGLRRNQPNGPFGFAYYDAYYTLMIDPDPYLRAIMNDFLFAGGKIVQKAFDTEADLESLPQDSIVNCMGLGAGAVFGDETIIPARGQLSFLLPQSDIDYGYAGSLPGHGLLYMFPRTTGILLGGSVDKGDGDLSVRPGEVERMVEGHRLLAERIAA